MKAIHYFIGLLFFTASFEAHAESDSSSAVIDSSLIQEAYMQRIDSFIQTFEYKTGHIDIGSVVAVDVPDGFKFLSARHAQIVLTELWDNPPDNSILGMLIPDSIDFFDASSWAICYSYDEDGHVKDDDAAEINYTDLLEQMKEEGRNANESRVKEGYRKIELVGWAQPPYYDKTTHKLHWAKELSFENDPVNTLNYNIRMLGRKGVLVMNIIAGLDHMPVVKSHMNTILASTNFTNGNRYEDFDDSIDKVAEYGIGGLVAGAVLAKTGILAKIGLLLLKTWKFIALGIVAFFSYFKKKLFAKKV